MIAPRLDRAALAAVPHGGPASAADGGWPAVELDFSTNVNAWGPAPAVIEALRASDPEAYPDPDARAPRAAAAALWALPAERISFGAGAVDLIDRIARAYLAAGDRALIAAPAFGEYARSVRLVGAEAIEVRAGESPADPAAEDVVAAIRNVGPRLVFLASPGSPLGVARTDAELERIADAIEPTGLLVLDEAYRSFAERRLAPPALPHRDAVVHVRSITKDCALAGVRAAFAVAHPDVRQAVERAGVPWSASAQAQDAAVAALSPAGAAHVERTVHRLAVDRSVLGEALAALGLEPSPSATNYLCVRVGDAAGLAASLRSRGIRIRDCASFGLPGRVRIAVRTPAENRRLVQAIEEVRC